MLLCEIHSEDKFLQDQNGCLLKINFVADEQKITKFDRKRENETVQISNRK
jgi:hypothetical protein